MGVDRLNRPWWARLIGTTPNISFVWWGLLFYFPIALANGDLDFGLVTISMLGDALFFAVAEWTAWATVDDREVRWRSVLRVRSVPLAGIRQVEESRALMPGEIFVLTLRDAEGRRRWVGPSTGVGPRRLAAFRAAIEDRMA